MIDRLFHVLIEHDLNQIKTILVLMTLMVWTSVFDSRAERPNRNILAERWALVI